MADVPLRFLTGASMRFLTGAFKRLRFFTGATVGPVVPVDVSMGSSASLAMLSVGSEVLQTCPFFGWPHLRHL